MCVHCAMIATRLHSIRITVWASSRSNVWGKMWEVSVLCHFSNPAVIGWWNAWSCVSSTLLSLSGCILGPQYRPGGGLHPHVVGLHLPCTPVLWGGWQAWGVESPLPVLLHHAVLHRTDCSGYSQPGYRQAQKRAGEATSCFIKWICTHIDWYREATNSEVEIKFNLYKFISFCLDSMFLTKIISQHIKCISYHRKMFWNICYFSVYGRLLLFFWSIATLHKIQRIQGFAHCHHSVAPLGVKNTSGYL